MTCLQDIIKSNDKELIKRNFIDAHRVLHKEIIVALYEYDLSRFDRYFEIKKKVFGELFGDIGIDSCSFGCEWVKINGFEQCDPCLFYANFCENNRQLNRLYDWIRFDRSYIEKCVDVLKEIINWEVV